MRLDSSCAYTPIPRFRLVSEDCNAWSIGGRFLIAFCSTGSKIGLVFNLIKDMKFQAKSHVYGLIQLDNVALQHHIGRKMVAVNATLSLAECFDITSNSSVENYASDVDVC